MVLLGCYTYRTGSLKPVEPEALLQLESLPSTNVDDQGELDIIEDHPWQVERKVYWMVDVIGMISILNGMILRF